MLRPEKCSSGLALMVMALGSSGAAMALSQGPQRPRPPAVVSVRETCEPHLYLKNRWVLTRAKRYDNGVTVITSSGEACQPPRAVTPRELPSVRTVLNTPKRRQAALACLDGVTVRVAPDGRIDTVITARDRGPCTVTPSRRTK